MSCYQCLVATHIYYRYSNLIAALQQLEMHTGFHHVLSLDKLNQYSLIVHMKTDILLPQPLDKSPYTPLKILSTSIV